MLSHSKQLVAVALRFKIALRAILSFVGTFSSRSLFRVFRIVCILKIVLRAIFVHDGESCFELTWTQTFKKIELTNLKQLGTAVDKNCAQRNF